MNAYIKPPPAMSLSNYYKEKGENFDSTATSIEKTKETVAASTKTSSASSLSSPTPVSTAAEPSATSSSSSTKALSLSKQMIANSLPTPSNSINPSINCDPISQDKIVGAQAIEVLIWGNFIHNIRQELPEIKKKINIAQQLPGISLKISFLSTTSKLLKPYMQEFDEIIVPSIVFAYIQLSPQKPENSTLASLSSISILKSSPSTSALFLEMQKQNEIIEFLDCHFQEKPASEVSAAVTKYLFFFEIFSKFIEGSNKAPEAMLLLNNYKEEEDNSSAVQKRKSASAALEEEKNCNNKPIIKKTKRTVSKPKTTSSSSSSSSKAAEVTFPPSANASSSSTEDPSLLDELALAASESLAKSDTEWAFATYRSRSGSLDSNRSFRLAYLDLCSACRFHSLNLHTKQNR